VRFVWHDVNTDQSPTLFVVLVLSLLDVTKLQLVRLGDNYLRQANELKNRAAHKGPFARTAQLCVYELL